MRTHAAARANNLRPSHDPQGMQAFSRGGLPDCGGLEALCAPEVDAPRASIDLAFMGRTDLAAKRAMRIDRHAATPERGVVIASRGSTLKTWYGRREEGARLTMPQIPALRRLLAHRLDAFGPPLRGDRGRTRRGAPRVGEDDPARPRAAPGVRLPLEETAGDFGRKTWRLKASPGSPSFCFDEAAALSLARRLLDPLAGTPFWSAAPNAFQKFQATLGESALRDLDQFAALVRCTGVRMCHTSHCEIRLTEQHPFISPFLIA